MKLIRNYYAFMLVFMFSLTSVFAYAQNLEQDVEDIIKEQYKEKEPGASVLIAKDGKVIYEKGFGIANMELDIPVNTDMVF